MAQIRAMLGVVKKVLDKYLSANGKSFWKAQLQSNLQPGFQGSLLGRVGENPGNEVE